MIQRENRVCPYFIFVKGEALTPSDTNKKRGVRKMLQFPTPFNRRMKYGQSHHRFTLAITRKVHQDPRRYQ